MSAPLAATNRGYLATTSSSNQALPDTERSLHERCMQLAVEQAMKNPTHPFGAVIVEHPSGKVLAQAVNNTVNNPMFHGEVACINDYVAKHGNQGWNQTTLYTTAEPCPMCMSAIILARIPRVIWGSSIQTVLASGIAQSTLSAREVAAAASSLYRPELLLDSVLAHRTDQLFANRLAKQPPGKST
ncbi:nucleoside deaminase [Dyella flagellata]|nr:nucleoside deaminase [Dyella flagellata]